MESADGLGGVDGEEGIVWVVATPACCITVRGFADEAKAPLGLPCVIEGAVPPDLAVEFVAVGCFFCGWIVGFDDSADGRGEGGLDGFIGVEVERPGLRAVVEGELLLLDMAAPVLMDDAGAGTLEDLDGAIGGAGIDGDDLGGEVFDGVERARDGGLVVAADDGDGEGEGHWWRWSGGLRGEARGV